MGITYAIAIPLGILQGALEKDAPEASIGVAIIGNVVSNLVQIFLGIGQAIISLKVARGMPATVGDLFSGGPRFLPVLGASILAGIALLAGMMLCIVPGVLLAIWFWPFYFLIVEEKTQRHRFVRIGLVHHRREPRHHRHPLVGQRGHHVCRSVGTVHRRDRRSPAGQRSLGNGLPHDVGAASVAAPVREILICES